MRSYPQNSPRAAARLVALAMIADGNVCRAELDAVPRSGAESALGLAPGELSAVLQSLCEDLLLTTQSHGSLTSCIDDGLLDSLAREVDDSELQRQVMAAIFAAAAADGHLSEGERCVREALRRCWNERPHVLSRVPANIQPAC